MQVGLLPFGRWENLNDSAKAILPANLQKNDIWCFQGLGHGLFEVCYGIAHFFPHKKDIAVIDCGSPLIDKLLAPFFREAYQIQRFKRIDISDPEAWVNSLSSDIAFVVHAVDHAFTGQLYHCESLDKKLNDKKIVAVRVSHAAHFLNPPEQLSHQVLLMNWEPNLAVAALGPRVRWNPIVSPMMNWPDKKISWPEVKEDKDLVLEFEAAGESYYKPYFAGSETFRLYDRAVVLVPGVGGESLLTKLSLEMGEELQPVGVETRFETTHLCRWGGFKPYTWWGQPALVRDEEMELVAISLETLQKPNFLSIFKRSIKDRRT